MNYVTSEISLAEAFARIEALKASGALTVRWADAPVAKRTVKAKANGEARFAGYLPVVEAESIKKAKVPGPTMIVVFADGVTKRLTFSTPEGAGKPVNTALGLRLAVNAYRASTWTKYRKDFTLPVGGEERLQADRAFQRWIDTSPVPMIVSAHVEARDGSLVGTLDADEANAYTATARAGDVNFPATFIANPAQVN